VRRAAALALAACCTGALAAEAPPGRAQAQACAPCHGALGVSTAPDAPHLAGQPRFYVMDQLKAFRSGKRKHEVMNVIAKPLTDTDIEQLAEWYESISIQAREKP
jgi:cytochrome c553